MQGQKLNSLVSSRGGNCEEVLLWQEDQQQAVEPDAACEE